MGFPSMREKLGVLAPTATWIEDMNLQLYPHWIGVWCTKAQQ